MSNKKNRDSEFNFGELAPHKLPYDDAYLKIEKSMFDELMDEHITYMLQKAIYSAIQCVNNVASHYKCYRSTISENLMTSRLDSTGRDTITISFNVSEDDLCVRTLLNELAGILVKYKSVKYFEKYLRSFISHDMKTIWSIHILDSMIYIMGAEYFTSSDESPVRGLSIGDTVARIHVPTVIFDIEREENARENINFIFYSYRDLRERF